VRRGQRKGEERRWKEERLKEMEREVSHGRRRKEHEGNGWRRKKEGTNEVEEE